MMNKGYVNQGSLHALQSSTVSLEFDDRNGYSGSHTISHLHYWVLHTVYHRFP